MVLIAGVLRVIRLGGHPVWSDEAHSVLTGWMGPVGIVRALPQDSGPPLFFWILHYWIMSDDRFPRS